MPNRTDPRRRAPWGALAALAALLVLTACGQAGTPDPDPDPDPDPTPAVVSVAVDADAGRVATDVDVALTATVVVENGASTAVTWSVSPDTDATLTPSGASATFSAAAIGTYTITATSNADGTKLDSVDVIVELATRINAGGAEYTATDGRVFAADDADLAPDSSIYPPADQPDHPVRTADILNTTEDEPYRSERAATNLGGGVLTYAIDVPLEGEYQVVLHLAELFWRADGGDPDNGDIGTRVFDVAAEGTLLLDDYDLLAEADAIGSPETGLIAFVESFTVEVTDGTLDLTFTSVAGDAKVNAIEVVYLGPAPL